jgi:exopolysaccharide production protein ExoQ
MVRTIALLAGFACIGWMLVADSRWRRLPSRALWIPAISLALASSRQIGFWLAQFGIGGGAASTNLEGSPINQVFTTGVFLAAIVVLWRRRFSWTQYALANKALFAIYAFYLFSMLWSAFPVPTVKRLVQEFGWVLIAPIILTEKNPSEALRVVFVRVSYFLFPLSVIFIRYFPEIGRIISGVSGTQMLRGVTDHKNSLGQMTMVFCLVLLWDLMETRENSTTAGVKPNRWARLVNMGIGLYLLVISASATPAACFVLGVVLLFAGRRLTGFKNARPVFAITAVSVVLLVAIELTFGISGRVSEAMDRGTGLTGRTDIWRVILEKNTSYLVGAGFRGFWETAEGVSVAQELGTNQLITAHNGYLEAYLNGGVVSLVFLAAFLWSTGLNATEKVVRGEGIGRLAVVFWPLLLVSNVTESVFFQTGPLWFAMLLVTIDNPQKSPRRAVGARAAQHVKSRRSGGRFRVQQMLSAPSTCEPLVNGSTYSR